MSMNKITQEKFLAYETVRESGETNMFDINKVIELADVELTREDIINIMKNYGDYKEKWLG